MTKHLDSLKIQNFRMLEDFEVEKLGQVNLIVGKNNSGKSTVLEALRIYAGNADRHLLEEIAKEHGEKFKLFDDEVGNPKSEIYFKDFFSGRKLHNASFFHIGEFKNPNNALFLVFVNGDKSGFEQSHPEAISLFKIAQKEWKQRKIIRSFFVINGKFRHVYMIDEPNFDVLTTGLAEDIPCSSTPTQLPKLEELAEKWDSIVFTDAEKEVVNALSIIEPTIQGIAFIQDKNKVTGERTAIVRLQGQAQPVPLKSLGDGMQRLLQIALNIYQAKDGFLLIDEFENGLHYSVQEKVWGLIFEMAKRLNIQVFATTHSWDCIEAFSKVAVERTDVEGLLFRMGRSAKTSDNGKIIATIFDEAKLERMTQADMEIR